MDWQAVDDAFPRLRYKLLLVLFSLGGPDGWQYAYVLTNRNKVFA